MVLGSRSVRRTMAIISQERKEHQAPFLAKKQRDIRPEQDSVSTPLRPRHHHGGSRNNVKAKTGRTTTEHWLLDRKWLLQQGIHNSCGCLHQTCPRLSSPSFPLKGKKKLKSQEYEKLYSLYTYSGRSGAGCFCGQRLTFNSCFYVTPHPHSIFL